MRCMQIPSELARSLVGHWCHAGEKWLEALPGVIAEAEVRWGISIGVPFEPGGFTSFVAPASTSGGTEVVYKCTVPHEEAADEPAALAAYGSFGAVQLLASEPATFELLVERCTPGMSLWSVRDDAERGAIATDLMRRLWLAGDSSAVGPFEPVMAQWADLTERRLVTSELPWVAGPIERGIDLLRTLPSSATNQVLLHGDFHPGNILAAEREPWLAIDPKPMGGDPAYEPIQLLTQRGGRVVEPPTQATIRRRLDLLGKDLDLDPDRIRQWGLARSAEWSMWSFENGAIVDAAIQYSWARALDRLAPN